MKKIIVKDGKSTLVESKPSDYHVANSVALEEIDGIEASVSLAKRELSQLSSKLHRALESTVDSMPQSDKDYYAPIRDRKELLREPLQSLGARVKELKESL